VKILLKSLVVWIMLMAVPFQGFASAMMLTCAPIQPISEDATGSVFTSPYYDYRVPNASQEMEHAQSGHVTPLASDTDLSEQHRMDGSCKDCVSCHFGTAMAPSLVTPFAFSKPQLATDHFTLGRLAHVDLALPERPPQLTLT
jgi:hypothetical protein